MTFKVFTILFISLTIASCGSRDIQFEEFSDSILDGLKKKQQNECLIGKAAIIQSWQDKWATIYASTAMNIARRYTFNFNVSGEPATTHNLTVTVYDKPDDATIRFLVENENLEDADVRDLKMFTYTQNNHNDHVQLLIAEACIAENPVISQNQVIFELDGSSKIDQYRLIDIYPAFFARYLSFTREVRATDTADTRGAITKTITAADATVQALSSTPSPTGATPCNFSTVQFDVSDVFGPPTNATSTVLNLIGIREENGYGPNCL